MKPYFADILQIILYFLHEGTPISKSRTFSYYIIRLYSSEKLSIYVIVCLKMLLTTVILEEQT